MSRTWRDWRGPRRAASAQVMPSSVAAQKLAAARAHTGRAAPRPAQTCNASSTSCAVPTAV